MFIPLGTPVFVVDALQEVVTKVRLRFSVVSSLLDLAEHFPTTMQACFSIIRGSYPAVLCTSCEHRAATAPIVAVIGGCF
eukprot:3933700-Amphidinium_carterae.1